MYFSMQVHIVGSMDMHCCSLNCLVNRRYNITLDYGKDILKSLTAAIFDALLKRNSSIRERIELSDSKILYFKFTQLKLNQNLLKDFVYFYVPITNLKNIYIIVNETAINVLLVSYPPIILLPRINLP